MSFNRKINRQIMKDLYDLLILSKLVALSVCNKMIRPGQFNTFDLYHFFGFMGTLQRITSFFISYYLILY